MHGGPAALTQTKASDCAENSAGAVEPAVDVLLHKSETGTNMKGTRDALHVLENTAKGDSTTTP